MNFKKPKFILSDIEGTTTSISFVTDELFPYFRENIAQLLSLKTQAEAQIQQRISAAFEETIELAQQQDGATINSDQQVIDTLLRWSLEDRKITPLKSLQGILWQAGYANGTLKGHVYDDVNAALENWKEQDIQLGIFSSGSVAAQKLLFSHSIAGDLRPFFCAYFDTTTGSKKESATYQTIAQQLNLKSSDILFLSDSHDELVAADQAQFNTLQLVRAGTQASWKNTVENFKDIVFSSSDQAAN